ncbi:hypothetical protein [Persephonella sp.]
MEVLFESKRFEVLDGMEKDLSLFAEKVGNFFIAEMHRRNLKPKVEYFNSGVNLILENGDVNMFVRISTIWKEITSLDESMIAFRCYTGYTLTGKGKLKALLGKISPEEKLLRLNWIVKDILSSDDKINILNIKEDAVSI